MLRRPCLTFLILLIFFTGCYDLETEIRILPDGSGFLTGWVRVDRRDAEIVMALAGKSLAQQIDESVEGLRGAVEESRGVELVDHSVFDEGDKTVLRYRVLFDNAASLDAFLASRAAVATPILLAAADLDYQGGPCGPASVSLKVKPRPPETLFAADDPMLRAMEPQTYRAFLDKIFSGRLRLRIVPMGKVVAHDAPVLDAQGMPVYDKRLVDLFRGGMTAHVRSEAPCDRAPQAAAEASGVTLGPAPTAAETASVMQGLPLLVHADVEFTQTARREGNLVVQFDVEPAMKDAVEFYLPVLLTIFPGSLEKMTWSAEKSPEGIYRYRFRSSEPIDFGDTKSAFLFLGRDGGKDIFRMKLPAFPWAPVRPADAPARRLMTVKVRLLQEIGMTNSNEHVENAATWTVTDQMLRNEVTLEAVSK